MWVVYWCYWPSVAIHSLKPVYALNAMPAFIGFSRIHAIRTTADSMVIMNRALRKIRAIISMTLIVLFPRSLMKYHSCPSLQYFLLITILAKTWKLM